MPQVNIKQIITAFIDRLAAFALRERENQDDENAETKGSSDAKRSSSPTDAAATATGIPNDIKLFEIFWEQVSGIIKSRAELTLEDVVQLLVSLENLGLSCYPARLDYVEKIYAFAREQFAAVKPYVRVCVRVMCCCGDVDACSCPTISELMDNRSLSKPILKLLTGPLEIYPDITTVLNNGPLLDSICSLLAVLPFSIRHAAALIFLRDMLKRGTRLTNPDHVQRVLGDLLAPLVRDQKDGGAKAGKSQSLSSSDKIDADEWRTEQNEMAKLVHLLYDDAVDVDQCFLVLNVVRKQLGEGGVDRVRHTLPSLMTSCLKLARRYRRMQSKRSDSDGGSSDAEQWEKKLLALFKFMHQTVLVVYKAEHHELALRLFLLPLQDPSVLVGFEMIAYEYIVQVGG